MSSFLTDPGQLAVDNVRSLSPYVPGKPIEELQRELGLTDIIKLASNENPFGPSPRALAAMQRALADTWLYPDGSGHVLKRKLAAKLGVDVAQITLGNGSNDRAGAARRSLPAARPRGHLLAVRIRGVSDRGAGHGRHRRGHAGDLRRLADAARPRSRGDGARDHAAHARRLRRQP